MSPGMRGKRVSSMRMPTVKPYWLKPPRTRPVVMATYSTAAASRRAFLPRLRRGYRYKGGGESSVRASHPRRCCGRPERARLVVSRAAHLRRSGAARGRRALLHRSDLSRRRRGRVPARLAQLAHAHRPHVRLLSAAASRPGRALRGRVAVVESVRRDGHSRGRHQRGRLRAAGARPRSTHVGRDADERARCPVADHRRPARRLPIVAGALLLGVTVALVQLVPMAELIRYADVPATGRGRVREADNLLVALGYGLIGDWTVIRRDLPTAVTLVSPDFLGSPVNGTYWWKGYTLLEMMVYSGLLPLFFAGYAAVRRRETAGVGIWLLLTAVGFGAAYALPVFNLVNYVPILGLVNNGRLRFVFRFGLIMAAAFGLDRLMRDVAARRLRPWPWLGGFAALVLAVPILVWAALVWTGRAPPPPSAMLGRQAGVVVVAAALLALGVLATRGILGRRAFVAAVVALAFVDALWHLGNFNGAIPRRDVFPQTPVVRFLKSDASLFRVSSGPAFMAANVKLPYRLFDVDLFDVLNLRRYASLQQVVNGQVFGADNTAHFFIFRRPQEYGGLMDLRNVQYVFTPPAGHR